MYTPLEPIRQSVMPIDPTSLSIYLYARNSPRLLDQLGLWNFDAIESLK